VSRVGLDDCEVVVVREFFKNFSRSVELWVCGVPLRAVSIEVSTNECVFRDFGESVL